MQDFHADCIINLQVMAHGRPAKLAWSCSLVTRDSVRLVLARRFVGMVSRDKAEWSAAVFGLRQAQRLLQEKVQLCSDFSLPLDDTGKHRDPQVQLMKAEARSLWAGFRLKKTGTMKAEEELLLKEEAERAFSRKPRRAK